MRKEAGNWRPGHWSPQRVARVLKHVFDYAANELSLMVGPYEGALTVAELRAWLLSEKSARLLAHAGVKTLGRGGEHGS